MTQQQTRALAPIDHFRADLVARQEEFERILPKQVPAAKFLQTVETAARMNPNILNCEKQSIMTACMKAAADGLILDGREAALVEFSGKAQYMPMMAGILKKVRQSGELESIAAHVAYERDSFTYELGDDEKIIHKPHLGTDRGNPILVYGIARLKGGGVMREVMTRADVEKVRAVSRAKNAGPWKDWWDEMAKKTVLRRLSKRLPMSSDLANVFTADDDLYDLEQQAEGAPPAPAQQPAKRRGAAADKLRQATQQQPVTDVGDDGMTIDNGPPMEAMEPEEMGQQADLI